MCMCKQMYQQPTLTCNLQHQATYTQDWGIWDQVTHALSMTSASSLHSFAVTASSESCFVLPKLFNPLLHFLLHSHQYLPLMMGCPAPLPDVGLPLICQCAWNAVELVACCKALSCGLTGELGSNYMLHAMFFFPWLLDFRAIFF